jgi:hypothetical protein
MDDLNRTTNRLRRKFEPTPNYLETKAQMEQVMVKGNYSTQTQRYWAALRAKDTKQNHSQALGGWVPTQTHGRTRGPSQGQTFPESCPRSEQSIR